MPRLVGVVLAVALVSGCAGTENGASSPTSETSAPTGAVAEATASAIATHVASGPPAEESPSSPPAGGMRQGTVAVVVTDDLRVRSAPGVTEESIVYETLLQADASVLILEGPVPASGYEWYRVLTFGESFSSGFEEDFAASNDGWVAVADKDGETWLQPAEFDCPPLPSTVEEVDALEPTVAVGCFAGQPMAFVAEIWECPSGSSEFRPCEGGDTGAGSVEPAWFGGSQAYLQAPGSEEEGGPINLRLDPDAERPDPLPFDTPVLITGLFGHPLAPTCIESLPLLDAEPSTRCWSTFVVTRIEPE